MESTSAISIISASSSSSSDLEEVTPTRKRKRLTKKWIKNVMYKKKIQDYCTKIQKSNLLMLNL